MLGRAKWAVGAAALVGWQALRRRRYLDLEGKVALVTGGSRGLGLFIARELARRGCKVAICARDQAELERAADDLAQRGAEVLAVRCDVGDREAVEAMVAEVRRTFGAIDVLVNNAGVISVGPVETMTVGDFEHAMRVGFFGALHATLAVLPDMRARRSGRVVNITSIGGEVAVPHLVPYDCAKFAAVGLSEGLRAELARDNVLVTTVVPGLMRTGGSQHALFKGRREREHTWFALADSSPLTSMSAVRAARRIADACQRGESYVTLTWQAKLLRLAHALFPGLTADALGQLSLFLPPPPPRPVAPLPGHALDPV